MKNKITISLIQMDIKTNHVSENLIKASNLIEKAEKYTPDFVLLPEMWTTGFAYDNLVNLAKQYNEEIISFLTYNAKRLKSVIIGGSTPCFKDNKLFNRCYIFGKNGAIIGEYDKVHVFSPFEEDKYFTSGEKIQPFKTEVAKIGVAICYDLRFPELTRKLALEGIEILFIPAQFPKVREDHWSTLLKARAIENAIFVCACNRVGYDKKFEYGGSSQIIDPWGEIIAKGSTSKEEIIVENINLQKIYEVREKIPIYKDRKEDLY